MKKLLKTISHSTAATTHFFLLGFAALLPLLLLPLTTNFVLESKYVVVFFAALLVYAAWAVYTFARKSIQITSSPFLLPILLFAVATLTSILVNGGYVVEQFVGLGGVYITMAFFVIFGSSLLQPKHSRQFVMALTLTSLVLTLTAIAETLSSSQLPFPVMGPSRLLNVFFRAGLPNSPLTSLTGSPTVAAELLFVTLAGLVSLAFTSVKEKSKSLPFYIIAGVIILAGLAVNIYTVYQSDKATPSFMPFGAAWSIAIDTLKNPRTALVGFGPERYSHVYLAFKPAWMNMTQHWGLTFNQANNVPFSLLTTLGIFGLASWVLLVVQGIRFAKKTTSQGMPAMVVFFSIVFIQLFLPPNVVLLTIQALALAFWVAAEKSHLKDIQLHAFTVQIIRSGNDTQRVPQHSHFMTYVFSAVNLIIIGTLGYLIGRHTLSQVYAFQANYVSVKMSTDAEVLKVHELQRKAIAMNEYIDIYHKNYSSTNMLIAISVSNSPNASAQDKEQVLGIVKEGIDQAKTAILLDLTDSTNWLHLAKVYNSLVGSADQAEQWAAQTYLQTIALAPNDPILHLELGGVFFKAGAYEQALQEFDKAASLKPDMPEAYYNMALTFRQAKDTERAIAAYEKTISLLPADSEFFSKIKSELDELRSGGAVAGSTTQTPTEDVTPQVTPVASPAPELIAPTAKATESPKLNEESQEQLNQDPNSLPPAVEGGP